uniref:WAP domain-containing protein n=1 Tax=Gouania willdenowi TaxID=441366 RepID=A0A8C5D9Z5_GOUWI
DKGQHLSSYTDIIQTKDKPGSCPHHVWNPDWKPCADKCHNDYDCGYNEKCCRQGCGHECVVTTPIKPGKMCVLRRCSRALLVSTI